MVSVESQMLPLGTEAPGFELPNHNPTIDAKEVSLDDLAQGSDGVLVAFLCQHCPYVKHVEDELAEAAREFQDRGVAVVGICSNDLDEFPEDGPDGIAEQCQRAGFDFPYLLDETQEVARAYKAACTPDFYLFDDDLELFYRGQFDSTRPDGHEPTGHDLRDAAAHLLTGQDPPSDQHPSMGCNVKWKPGREPDYF
jgi:peroxiredoxin